MKVILFLLAIILSHVTAQTKAEKQQLLTILEGELERRGNELERSQVGRYELREITLPVYTYEEEDMTIFIDTMTVIFDTRTAGMFRVSAEFYPEKKENSIKFIKTPLKWWDYIEESEEEVSKTPLLDKYLGNPPAHLLDKTPQDTTQ